MDQNSTTLVAVPERRRRMDPLVLSALLDAQHYNCVYCGAPDPETVDHVIPVSRGGSRGRGQNLVSACRACNSSKGKRTPAQWLIAMQGQPHRSEYKRRLWLMTCPFGLATVNLLDRVGRGE